MDGSNYMPLQDQWTPPPAARLAVTGVRREILLTLVACCVALLTAFAVHATLAADAPASAAMMLE